MRTFRSLLLSVFILLTALLSLQTAIATEFPPDLRWCAIGDSITHGGSYHRYISLFYATRFPGRSFAFFNCGISGDTASGALRRFDADILRHQPNLATIMLGMNDVSRNLYEPGEASPELLQKREAALSAHFANMRKLCEKLKSTGATIMFLTPSIYDETSKSDTIAALGVNGALARCAENVRELAREFGASVVDFHGPMSEINRVHQLENPKFSIVGADRIHPGDPGHFVMAHLFLSALQIPKLVSEIHCDAAGKDSLQFTFTEEALPFPVPESCKAALQWVPFQHELNQETLQILNLPEGLYQLEIDGKRICSATASELAQGINLADHPDTPQYLQALEVAKLDEQRHDIVKQLRLLDYVEWKMGRDIGDPSEFDWAAAAQKLLDNPKITGWPRDRVKDYEKAKPQQTFLRKQLVDLVEQIGVAVIPKPHEFRVHK